MSSAVVTSGGVGGGRDIDSSFEGFTAPELPSVALNFATKEECVTNPDAVVDIKEENSWIRIPITDLELFINKDGPAHITRTAKVSFPAEWGGHPISQYVNGFQAQNQPDTGDPYDEARIFERDQRTGGWQITHYGYVGGVGPAAQTGVFKFWVYDPADLMKGIQVSKSWGEPTIAQVMDFALNGTDESGRPVGINKRSVFEDVQPYIAGIQEVKAQKEDARNLGTGGGGDEPLSASFNVGPYQIDISDLADDIYNLLAGSEQTQGLLAGQKRFQVNRHNMVDMMNWFAAEVGGKWHFEPTPDGPILFFDNTSSRGVEAPDGEIARRVFVEQDIVDDDDITEPSGFRDRSVFAGVDTLDNDALVDIKPFNTLYLYGESTTFREKYDSYGASGAPGIYTESYPFVKLTYGPLLERAGGYEYSAPPIESDKVYLDQAEHAAIEEFRSHLSEETEGNIMLKGEPHILPYDYLRTIPACNDIFPNIVADPITYEVNGVKHRRKAGERYTTEVQVSIVFAEEDLTVESEYREA